MQLVTHTRMNQRFFEKGSGPTKAQWTKAILNGEINGKVGMGKVWVDKDDFLSRDFFNNNLFTNEVELDLLSG
jgi:hypothetical protein